MFRFSSYAYMHTIVSDYFSRDCTIPTIVYHTCVV